MLIKEEFEGDEQLEVMADDMNILLDMYAEEDYRSVTPDDIVDFLNSRWRKWGN